MGSISRCIQADMLKSRHTLLWPIHFFVPVVGAFVFAGYFRMAGRTVINNVCAFLEMAAIVFPFLVGVIVAMVIALESEAGNFQIMLGTLRSRTIVYIGKLFFLLMLAAMSLVLCIGVFAILYPMLPFAFYVKPMGVLFVSIVPVYLISMLLGLKYGKSVSMGLGIVGSLVSALMMTGLGDFVWKFVPWAWGVRFVDFCILEYSSPQQFSQMFPECVSGVCIMLAVTVVLAGVSLVWFNTWDGKKSDG